MNATQYTTDALIILYDNDPVHVQLDTMKAHLSSRASRFRRVVDQPELFTAKNITIILRELWDCPVEPVARTLQEHAIFIIYASGDIQPSTLRFSHSPPLVLFRKGNQIFQTSTFRRTRQHSARFFVRANEHARSWIIYHSQLLMRQSHRESPLSHQLPPSSPSSQNTSAIVLASRPPQTKTRATDAFKRCERLHLACHGIPDKAHAFESCFALYDGRLTLKKRVQSDFGNPEFAFLSACRTTVGDATTPDEVIHLAAAMQSAGLQCYCWPGCVHFLHALVG